MRSTNSSRLACTRCASRAAPSLCSVCCWGITSSVITLIGTSSRAPSTRTGCFLESYNHCRQSFYHPVPLVIHNLRQIAQFLGNLQRRSWTFLHHKVPLSEATTRAPLQATHHEGDPTVTAWMNDELS